MRRRVGRGMAWGAWVVSVGLVTAGFVLLGLTGDLPAGTEVVFHYEDAAVGLAFGAIGALIVTHRPHNTVGWILAISGLSGALGVFTDQYGTYGALIDPGSLPMVHWVAWIGAWSWLPFFTLVPLVLLLFPDGRPPSARWRPLAWAIVTLTVGSVVLMGAGTLGQPVEVLINPQGSPLGPEAEVILGVGVVSLLVMALASIVSLVFRWRRSRSVERQQLKWFTTMAAAGIALRIAGDFLGPISELTNVVALLLIPAGIPIAILRYRLYDIDLVINRTMVYGALTAILGLVYVGSVMLLGGLLRPLAGSNDLAVAGSTLVVAVLFSPVRRRIQELVDRRFYRSRYDAAHTVELFALRLRDEVDLESLQADLTGVVRKTLQPALVSVWVRNGGDR